MIKKLFVTRISFFCLVFSLSHCFGKSSADQDISKDQANSKSQETPDTILSDADQDASKNQKTSESGEASNTTLSDESSDTLLEEKYPYPVQQYTFEQIKSMTISEMGDIGVDRKRNREVPHFVDLTTWKLEELEPRQLGELVSILRLYGDDYEITGHIHDITPDQIRALTKEQVKELGYRQIRLFTPEQIQVLTPEILQEIPTNEFTVEQIAAFDFEQIWVVERGLNAYQAAVISPEIIKKIPYGTYYVVTKEQVESLSKEQIAKGGFDELTPEQLTWLSPEQVSGVRDIQLAYLDADQIKALSIEQLEAIPVEKIFWLKRKPKLLAAMTVEQLSVFREDKYIKTILYFIENNKDFFEKALYTDGLNRYSGLVQYFPPERFNDVSSALAYSFPPDLLEVLTPDRIKEFPHYVKVLKPQIIENLTSEQIRAIPVNKMKDFKEKVLSEFNFEQIRAFNLEQLSNLNKDQISSLISYKADYYKTGHSFKKIYAVLEAVEKSQGSEDFIQGVMGVAQKRWEKECVYDYEGQPLPPWRFKECVESWDRLILRHQKKKEKRRKDCERRKSFVERGELYETVNIDWCMTGWYYKEEIYPATNS